MKKKKKMLGVIVLLTISLVACQKNSVNDQSKLTSQKTIKLENVVFAATASLTMHPNTVQTYDELACIVDKKAGTLCFASSGNSCSKATACTPIPTAAQSGNYTKEEIDHKIKMVEDAYGVKYIY